MAERDQPNRPAADQAAATNTEQRPAGFVDADTLITQPNLFSNEVKIVQAPVVDIVPPTAESSLTECAPAYQEYLRLTAHSRYTITCFLSDLRLLAEYLGKDTPIGRISNNDLTRWLMHLRWERGQQPAPKTMARRATFLKNFFGWLASESILPENAAAGIVLTRPLPPLPEMLYPEEIERLEEAAAEDSRSQCLVILLLHAGLKKEEVMALQLSHFDLSDPATPTVSVQFTDQIKQRKQRTLTLPPAFSEAFQRYLNKYRPQGKVFECTDRNLNYILARAVRKARIQKRVTLQLLRDTYAVRQLQEGLPLDTLREKLGLSEEAWKEASEKYRKLIGAA
ncbi:MAG TPA: tyrosine-type recombinase/integrase [Ktedonobacterales bacterium]|nr:tyrosine-type recombinase/integrase [Ktedonobacterales bacterium]